MSEVLVSAVDFALIVSVVWLIWAYLRGPHDLGRAFRGGDPLTPSAGWRALLCVGLMALDLGLHTWGASVKGIPHEAVGPMAVVLAIVGIALVSLGLVSGYRLQRGPRK